MNKTPSNSSTELLRRDGKESMLQRTKERITNSTVMSIARISTRSNITPSQAWELGTNVRGAFKHCPVQTHTALMALLKSTLDYLDYNKTIRKTEDFIDAVDYLIVQFPVMKIEEWKIVMTRLKAGHYGKTYERLQLPELVEAFQKYEEDRAIMIEKNLARKKDERNGRTNK